MLPPDSGWTEWVVGLGVLVHLLLCMNLDRLVFHFLNVFHDVNDFAGLIVNEINALVFLKGTRSAKWNNDQELLV